LQCGNEVIQGKRVHVGKKPDEKQATSHLFVHVVFYVELMSLCTNKMYKSFVIRLMMVRADESKIFHGIEPMITSQ
jgi:hypothetical protein